MSRADGVLRVVLTGKWFDMIESGEKLEEYRGGHWENKLLTTAGRNFAMAYGYDKLEPQHFHPYRFLEVSRGYTHHALLRPIKRIRWGKPRPEWSGDTVTGECFIIELETPE